MAFQCPKCGLQSLAAEMCPRCLVERRYIQLVPMSDHAVVALGKIDTENVPRIPFPSFPALEDMLEGGLVFGSTTLLHGGPGLGKTTLALQLANEVARVGYNVLYVTTEQMLSHLKLTANRIGIVGGTTIYCMATDNLDELLSRVGGPRATIYRFLIIDSIQQLKMFRPYDGNRIVRVTEEVVALARLQNIAVLMLQHVTKEDEFAGPRTIEHLVDGVIVFSAVLPNGYVLIIPSKYRFGPVPVGIDFLRRDHGGFDLVNARRAETTARGAYRRRGTGATPPSSPGHPASDGG